MPIIGNNVKEVHVKVERKRLRYVGVTKDILIQDVEKQKIRDTPALLFTCSLVTTYQGQSRGEKAEPLAKILVTEEIVYTDNEKELNEIHKEWEKSKTVPKKHFDKILTSLNTIALYDTMFFANHFRLPLCAEFVKPKLKEKPKKKKKTAKKKKGKK